MWLPCNGCSARLGGRSRRLELVWSFVALWRVNNSRTAFVLHMSDLPPPGDPLGGALTGHASPSANRNTSPLRQAIDSVGNIIASITGDARDGTRSLANTNNPSAYDRPLDGVCGSPHQSTWWEKCSLQCLFRRALKHRQRSLRICRPPNWETLTHPPVDEAVASAKPHTHRVASGCGQVHAACRRSL